MPINPNESLKNRHLLAMAQTGGGKTYYLNRLPILREKGMRRLVWDPYESPEHGVPFATTCQAFAKAVREGVKRPGGFQLGLAVNPTEANFEFWSRVVWAIADGKKPTVAYIEELADVAGSGKLKGTAGTMIRVGRKYNVAMIAATQRPQDIPKTILTQVSKKWVGYLEGYDREYVERALRLERGSLDRIEFESYRHLLVTGGRQEWGGPGDMRY